MTTRQTPSRSAGGFTLIEALVTLGLLFVAVMIVAPPLQNLIARSKVEGLVRDTAAMLQRARLEALTRSVPSAVTFDGARVFAYADVNGDTLYNPDGTLPKGRTDYELGAIPLPRGVTLEAPEGELAIRGLSTIGSVPAAMFATDGSILVGGAFRFSDERDNYLEVAIEPQATARVVVRKWQDAAWVSRTEGSRPWKWNH